MCKPVHYAWCQYTCNKVVLTYLSCLRVGKRDRVELHSTLSKTVCFKGKWQHFCLHVAAKIKLLQVTSFSLICQKQAHGKENWKGVVEKSCSLNGKMSLVDIALVSLKSVGNSTRKMELLWYAIVRWAFPFLAKESIGAMMQAVAQQQQTLTNNQ